MNIYIDKATIFILSAIILARDKFTPYTIVPLIAAVLFAAIMSLFDRERDKLAAAAIFIALAFFYPSLIYFLPLVCYDLYHTRWQPALVLGVFPLIVNLNQLPAISVLLVVLFAGLSWLTRRRTISLDKLTNEYIALRDSTKEFSILLESKNKELMEKQEYEIHLATLKERNRIARDIHDSVGHLLSNAILQTGALLAVCRDEALREKIHVLKDTLAAGMDSVRSSIHDLYDESLDLYSEIKRLTDGFDFCTIELDYIMDSTPSRQIKLTLILVVKEALSNIIRHSDATAVHVMLREHPALYQLTVRDNGSEKESSGEGLGLKNIAQRVESAGGRVHIGYNSGFTVFASIPRAGTGGSL